MYKNDHDLLSVTGPWDALGPNRIGAAWSGKIIERINNGICCSPPDRDTVYVRLGNGVLDLFGPNQVKTFNRLIVPVFEKAGWDEVSIRLDDHRNEFIVILRKHRPHAEDR